MPYIMSEYFAPKPLRQMKTGRRKHEQLQHSQGKDNFSVTLAGQSSTVKDTTESNQVQLSAKKGKKIAHGQQPKYEREMEERMAGGREDKKCTQRYTGSSRNSNQWKR